MTWRRAAGRETLRQRLGGGHEPRAVSCGRCPEPCPLPLQPRRLAGWPAYSRTGDTARQATRGLATQLWWNQAGKWRACCARTGFFRQTCPLPSAVHPTHTLARTHPPVQRPDQLIQLHAGSEGKQWRGVALPLLCLLPRVLPLRRFSQVQLPQALQLALALHLAHRLQHVQVAAAQQAKQGAACKPRACEGTGEEGAAMFGATASQSARAPTVIERLCCCCC
jgi:hypothetical protein